MIFSNFLFSFLTSWLFKVYCSISTCLWIFQFFPVLFCCVIGKDTWYGFNLFKFVELFCTLTDLFWRMLCVCLRRMCILMLLCGLFCMYRKAGSFGLQCWNFQVLYFSIDLLSGCSAHYWNGSIEICYYYCVAVFFSRQFLHVCFIYLGALMLGLYVLVRSSWELTFLSLYNALFGFVTVFDLKSILCY